MWQGSLRLAIASRARAASRTAPLSNRVHHASTHPPSTGLGRDLEMRSPSGEFVVRVTPTRATAPAPAPRVGGWTGADDAAGGGAAMAVAVPVGVPIGASDGASDGDEPPVVTGVVQGTPVLP